MLQTGQISEKICEEVSCRGNSPVMREKMLFPRSTGKFPLLKTFSLCRNLSDFYSSIVTAFPSINMTKNLKKGWKVN